MTRKKQNSRTSDNHHIATTRYLTRIITYLGETQDRTISDIFREIDIPTIKIKDAVNWLLNYKIIRKDHFPGKGVVYNLNEAYFLFLNEN